MARPVWRHAAALALAATVCVVLVGCGSSGASGSGKRGGGYYKDDGPDANPPANLHAVPDAVPRIEPYAPANMRPYAVFGKQYVPDTTGQPYKMRGRASWYGKKFHGNATANGERYDMYAMTAAHTTLPIPSYVRVTSMVNGRTVVLRVNDRGPFHSDRIIDLSYVAAYKLGLIGPGSGEVVIEKITHDDIRRGVGAAAGPSADTGAYPVAQAPLPLPTASSPTARPPATTARPAAGASGVFLQLGAFSQPGNAQALASRVQQEAGVQQVYTSTDQGAGLYRVRVGPYPDREAAVQAAQDIFHRIGIMPAIAAP